MSHFITIKEAMNELSQGHPLILVDAEDRENEGDLMYVAETITPQSINFMAKEARGQLCLALSPIIVERLEIPLMPERNKPPHQATFTASVEAAYGVSSGVSAFDRAHTIRVVVNQESKPDDIIMPGHVFPLCARPGGVLERFGHTEASVDLVKLAGFQPAAVICEIMNEDGTMARLKELREFSLRHKIKLVAIDDLIQYFHQIKEDPCHLSM